MTDWKSLNHSSSISDLTKPFSLDIPSKTDIWDKPPTTHDFSGPIIYRSLPLKSFRSLRATITGPWRQQYDQAGIILVVNPSSSAEEKQWIKSGIELLDGEARVGTVAKDRWSDWSLAPLPASGDERTATVEFEVGGVGEALWVRLVEGGKKLPLREVAWWATLKGDEELWVGVYGAKPSEGDGIRVDFNGVQVKTS